jgi:hypothetical protein
LPALFGGAYKMRQLCRDSLSTSVHFGAWRFKLATLQNFDVSVFCCRRSEQCSQDAATLQTFCHASIVSSSPLVSMVE